VSRDGRRLVLQGKDVPVVDSFQLGNPIQTPAIVSFRVEWRATGPAEQRGRGTAVPATDPAAFLGEFAIARAIGWFSGAEFGFSFRSEPGVSSDRGFAELGRERNGRFLS
jgi:hypothetical protein